MDLTSSVLEGCFARAFAMVDAKNSQQIDDTMLKNMAANWFESMGEKSRQPQAADVPREGARQPGYEAGAHHPECGNSRAGTDSGLSNAADADAGLQSDAAAAESESDAAGKAATESDAAGNTATESDAAGNAPAEPESGCAADAIAAATESGTPTTGKSDSALRQGRSGRGFLKLDKGT